MEKNLTTSEIERQNVLNNQSAVNAVQKELNIPDCFTKQMVADFYEVEERTIDLYIEKHEQELKHNGYSGLFSFKSFLNMGMLLQDSEKARQIRSIVLDFVIANINERTGGGTKYMSYRDINRLYNKTSTSSLNGYMDFDTILEENKDVLKRLKQSEKWTE